LKKYEEIDDPWLLGYREGSDGAPKRLPGDKEYEAGYEVGARHARVQARILGRVVEPSIFDFELLR
jgi:hypothetical protein